MTIFHDILWLLVLIGVMIMIHELGHYWAARFFDVRIETFSFGFGPRLFGFRRGETDFRFSAILFGGYVKMAGEQPGEGTADDPRAFLAKPRWQRLIIAFAGPFMNVVLAVALLTGLFTLKYPKPAPTDLQGVIGHVVEDSPAAKAGLREGDRIVQIDDIRKPSWQQIMTKEITGANTPLHLTIDRDGRQFQTSVTPKWLERAGVPYVGWSEEAEVEVASVSPGMPAEEAGLRPGDLLLRIDGESIRSAYKLHEVIRASNGKPVSIEYLRNGQKGTVTIKPVFKDVDGPERWMIGVLPEPRQVFTSLSIPDAFRESVKRNARLATLIYDFLKGIVEQRMSARSIDGPIRIAQLSGEAARQGSFAFISLMAMVSLNLAVINLLPIPILDGGVILMLLVEMTLRRDLSMQVKEAALKVGFVFLMAVMIFVLYSDITKVLPSG
jgi:regulator of sigma E protease